ncbi:MAG: sulfite exporter TauE/SafE family protein [Planctomycetota bacterium]
MFDAYTMFELVQVALLGLLAGTLGGMLGVGGSVVMIPGLVVVLGRPTGVEQHLYQAAAMIANVAVSVPAALRHRRAGAVQFEVVRWMLPAALGCIVLGVMLSNLPVFSGADGGVWLGRVLAVFLVYVVVVNVRKLLPIRPAVSGQASGKEEAAEQAKTTAPRSVLVGSIMGVFAGLMGVGGGAQAVPLQQALMRLPLRNCIANSSAVICFSAALGAVYKNLTLAEHNLPGSGVTLSWETGLVLGLLLAPTAWLGGRLGAVLTHRLPLRAIRVAFIGLMVVACWKMAALPI